MFHDNLQPEYSRPVPWDLDLREHPITPEELLKHLMGYTPRQAVQRIHREDAAVRLWEFAKQQLTLGEKGSIPQADTLDRRSD
jgi:hypothetical protein